MVLKKSALVGDGGSRGGPATTMVPDGEGSGGEAWSRRGGSGVTRWLGATEAATRLKADGGNGSTHENRRIRQQEMTQWEQLPLSVFLLRSLSFLPPSLFLFRTLFFALFLSLPYALSVSFSLYGLPEPALYFSLGHFLTPSNSNQFEHVKALWHKCAPLSNVFSFSYFKGFFSTGYNCTL